MKCYGSFLVRCWLAADASQGERTVLQIEHIQTGAATRAESLAEAERWMLGVCRAAQAPVGSSPEAGREQDGDGDGES